MDLAVIMNNFIALLENITGNKYEEVEFLDIAPAHGNDDDKSRTMQEKPEIVQIPARMANNNERAVVYKVTVPEDPDKYINHGEVVIFAYKIIQNNNQCACICKS